MVDKNTVKLVATSEWQELLAHFEQMRNVKIRDLFAQNVNRAASFAIEAESIFFDYSKNIITAESMKLLLRLAESRNLADMIEAMFSGKTINNTEHRAVLHTALRNPEVETLFVNGHDIMPNIRAVLAKMKDFSEKVRNQKWLGFSGKPVKNIVNIGIGGSDLGPAMVTEALGYYAHERLQFFFVSNVDDAHIAETLKKCDPLETLFIIASKTFTTQETMANAETAKRWIIDAVGSASAVPCHFVALSTNEEAVKSFGIDTANMFEFWDWVGGRYSLTSAIGLSIMTAVGYDNFMALLNGFHVMDNHFRTTSFEKNIPVIAALLGVWYNNFFACQTHVILPYSQYLSRLPVYLQQVDMESNGKSINRQGQDVDYQTGQIIWGEAGTNGQHSFYQLLHQGTKMFSADFIGFVNSLNNINKHHDKLMANFFAQTRALAFGRSEAEVRAAGTEEALVPYKVFAGNHPTNSILMDSLTPENLGRLIAMYEHKIFTQGVIWNINSFDQWGVELGKELASEILSSFDDVENSRNMDSSTSGLLNFYRAKRDNRITC